MPKRLTAQLLNAKGQVTTHTCVRLEKRGSGRKRSIYPVFRCIETGIDRDYGYLPCALPKRLLREFYPGIKLIDMEPTTDSEAVAA